MRDFFHFLRYVEISIGNVGSVGRRVNFMNETHVNHRVFHLPVDRGDCLGLNIKNVLL